jgi:diguanylate cyclase (GGDEF)-like protein/PAS domain S-box-containing protein
MSGEVFKAIVDRAVGPMLILDALGRITLATPALASTFGTSNEALIGHLLSDLVHPDDAANVSRLHTRPAVALTAGVMCRTRGSNAAWIDTELIFTDLRDDPAVQGIVVAIRDASHRRLADEALVHTALHDPLTGLPNRALLVDRLGHALARANRSVGQIALLFLDLDNFKVVNDSLGHLAGDLLLIELAHRLQASVRAGDTVARFGGDEFAVLLEDVSDAVEAVAKAERLANALRQPLDVDGREVRPNVSIGVALSTGRGDQPEDLLRRADLAMYQAKSAGKGRYSVFEPSMQARANARLELETGLRQALEKGELRIHFQPILALDNGRISGFEALVRWDRPAMALSRRRNSCRWPKMLA